MRKEEWLDRLLKKRLGRFIWMFSIIIAIALFWGTGIWLASLALVLPMLDAGSIIMGLLFGIAIVIGLFILISGIYALGKWLWNG